MDISGRHQLLQEALRQVLRPIIRLLLKAGWGSKEFVELAKDTFVEVATEEFGKRGRPANASRVAILTGLSRREVAQRRERALSHGEMPRTFMTRASRVLSGWHQDPEFIDEAGKPRDLALEGPHGTFEALSRRYAGDVPVLAVLKELDGGGALARREDGLLRVVKRSYVPQPMGDNQVRLWGSVLHDVASTLAHNLTRAEQELPRFERRAVNLEVERRYLPAFRALLEREGQIFLERIDDWLTAHAVREGGERRPLRLGVGLYQIQDA